MRIRLAIFLLLAAATIASAAVVAPQPEARAAIACTRRRFDPRYLIMRP